MKILSFVLLTVAIACGGGTKQTPTNTATSSTTGTGEGTPCTQEIALSCPEGQIDACLKPETNAPDDPAAGTGTAMHHKCVAK